MINNTYKSQSKQETDLYLLNRHVDECFADTIDYHVVKRKKVSSDSNSSIQVTNNKLKFGKEADDDII